MTSVLLKHIGDYGCNWMLIKGINEIKGMIISEIQWNEISIPFLLKLFLSGMIF